MKNDGNQLVDQSRAFAARVVNMYKFLQQKRELVISKQVLRSGTSIGANIAEAQGAQTRADFIYKIQIALKEANETDYWISLLGQTDYISPIQQESMKVDLDSLIFMMIRILKTAKQNSERMS